MGHLKQSLKPIIGVTGPNRQGTPAWLFTRYAIWRAGGIAKRITPSQPLSIEELDGLIIGGGADVNPSLYGEEGAEFVSKLTGELKKTEQSFASYVAGLVLYPLVYILRKLFSRGSVALIDKNRDVLEYNLIGQALEKQIPILGICRGAQLLNVYFGGSLHQELSGFYAETPEIRSIFPKKRIDIEPDSQLARILKTTSCKVNALNRQAIKDLGSDLIVTARESTAVIQAIEHKFHPFVVGVQWHPEYLPQHRRQQLIFQSLLRAAKRRRSEFERTC